MVNRTIVSGKIVLGAPLYIDGECLGIVKAVYRPQKPGYILCGVDTGLSDTFKAIVVDGEKIYLEKSKYAACINDAVCCGEWAGQEGLIGAGDIDDGDTTWIRVLGDDKQHRINPEPIQYIETRKDAKDVGRYLYTMYSDGKGAYMLPVYQEKYNYVDVYYLEDISNKTISPL